MLEEEASRLITTYQEIVTRQLCMAKEAGEMDDENFDRLISLRCVATSHEAISNHFSAIFAELTEYHRTRLLERIAKGEELIDRTPKDHPEYPQYVELYEGLHAKLQASYDRENKFEEETQ